jgi:predicted transcriptional regulator
MAPEGVDELRPPEEARKEQAKRFRRELARNAELVLREILLFPGLSVEQASEKLGISRPEVEAVVEKLAEENLVARIGENLWPAGPQQGSRHTFEVEKVLEGKAILRVDEKWYAVLDAEDFSGPRFVLKPGCRFEAFSELFHKDSEFHAKVFSVTRIFEL